MARCTGGFQNSQSRGAGKYSLMWFDDWWGIARVLIVGALAYVALVVLLRTSGKRTLSKMNAFDFVVTVALGSCLATILLSKDVPLAEGVAGLGVLIGMQRTTDGVE